MSLIESINISSNQLIINYKGPKLPPKPQCYNDSKGNTVYTLSCIDQKWYNKITFIDNNNKRHLYPEVYFLKDGESTARYLINKLGKISTINPSNLGLSTVDWSIIWALTTKDMNLFDDFIISSLDQCDISGARIGQYLKNTGSGVDYSSYPIYQWNQYKPGFKEFGTSELHPYKFDTAGQSPNYLWNFGIDPNNGPFFTNNIIYYIHDEPNIKPDYGSTKGTYTYRIPNSEAFGTEKTWWNNYFDNLPKETIDKYGRTLQLAQYDKKGNKINWYIVCTWVQGTTNYEIYFKNKKNRCSKNLFGISKGSRLYKGDESTCTSGGFNSIDASVSIMGHESQRASFGNYPTNEFSPGWDFINNPSNGGGLLQVSSVDTCDYGTAFGIWDSNYYFKLYSNNNLQFPTSSSSYTGYSISDYNKLYIDNNGKAEKLNLLDKNIIGNDISINVNIINNYNYESLNNINLKKTSPPCNSIIKGPTGNITNLLPKVVNNCIPSKSFDPMSNTHPTIEEILTYQLGDVSNPFISARTGLIHASRAGPWGGPSLFGKGETDPLSYVPCPRIPSEIKKCNDPNTIISGSSPNLSTCVSTKSMNSPSAFKCGCLNALSGKLCNKFVPGKIDTTNDTSNCNKDCYLGPFEISNCINSVGWNGPLTCYMYRQNNYSSNYKATLPLCRLAINSGNYIRELFSEEINNDSSLEPKDPKNSAWYKNLACQCPTEGVFAKADEASGCGYS